MTTLACKGWGVKQTVLITNKKVTRSPLDIAQDFERKLSSHFEQIVNSRLEQHTHLHRLQECYEWIQQQCSTSPDLAVESLVTLLSSILTWTNMRRVFDKELHTVVYKQQRAAIRAELGALRVRDADGKRQYIASNLLSYAFAQRALRDLREHTSRWTDSIKETQPRALRGRAGR